MAQSSTTVGELLEFPNQPSIAPCSMKWVHLEGSPSTHRNLIVTTRIVEEEGKMVEYGYEFLALEQKCRLLNRVAAEDDDAEPRFEPTDKEVVMRFSYNIERTKTIINAQGLEQKITEYFNVLEDHAYPGPYMEILIFDPVSHTTREGLRVYTLSAYFTDLIDQVENSIIQAVYEGPHLALIFPNGRIEYLEVTNPESYLGKVIFPSIMGDVRVVREVRSIPSSSLTGLISPEIKRPRKDEDLFAPTYTHTGNEFVVKVIRKAMLPAYSDVNLTDGEEYDPDKTEDALREISCMQYIKAQYPDDEGHNYLVRLIEAVHSRHYVYVVLPFYDKTDLFETLLRHKFSQADVKKILRGLILGLNLLKRCGLAHFDMSCENVLLRTDEHGQYVGAISDFGQARLIPRDANGDWLQIRTLPRGKKKYRPPEYANSGPICIVHCHPIDTWALGIILLYMLRPTRKMMSRDYGQLHSFVRSGALAAEISSTVSSSAAAFLSRLLQITPHTRIRAEDLCALCKDDEDNLWS